MTASPLPDFLQSWRSGSSPWTIERETNWFVICLFKDISSLPQVRPVCLLLLLRDSVMPPPPTSQQQSWVRQRDLWSIVKKHQDRETNTLCWLSTHFKLCLVQSYRCLYLSLNRIKQTLTWLLMMLASGGYFTWESVPQCMVPSQAGLSLL